MKFSVFFTSIILLISLNVFAGFSRNSKPPNEILTELSQTIRRINFQYALILSRKESELSDINRNLFAAKDLSQKVELLIEKERVHDEIRQLRLENRNDISKVRYLKGLQMIKILYEKVLSLDHHFASVRTFNEISKIANPSQYPEYEKLKEFLSSNKDKKTILELTPLLGTNTIVSIVQTLTNMVSSHSAKVEKEKELRKVECVLDFTLRMHNDLNTIYYETAFLQSSNEKIKQEIESLFKDYTKPIGYLLTLGQCRNDDDWEVIVQKVEEYLSKMKAVSGSSQYKMQVNLDFPVDRLFQFISQYNYFIDQGGRFYQKFSVILNSYENQKQCDSKLPLEYKKLKADINIAVDKFNVAYKPVEINGTKMKEILYGLNEFESAK